MFNSMLNMQCNTIADTFVLSGDNNWDSDDFAKKLFNTEWGINILMGISIYEYTCPRYMYSGLVDNLKKKIGKTYSSDILWYCGYLYRYIIENSKDTPKDIYKKAPINKIANGYEFYHTQDWDYVKNDLGIK